MSETTRLRPTWAENVQPTAREFRDWFVRCPSEQQIEIAQKALDNAERSHHCFLMNHDGLMGEARHLWTQNRRYRLAWKSASRYRVALWALRDRLKETP